MAIYNERHGGGQVKKNVANGVLGLDEYALVPKQYLPVAGRPPWEAAGTFVKGSFEGKFFYGNDRFVFNQAIESRVQMSHDGKIWTSYPAPGSGNTFGYANGLFFTVGGSAGYINVSPNAINWEYVQDAPDDRYWGYGGVAYGNGIYVMGDGDYGSSLTSKNGTVWVENVIDENLYGTMGVYYGGGLFFASYWTDEDWTTQQFYTSVNGLVWTERDIFFDDALTIIRYADGVFMLLAYSTNSTVKGLYRSSDGINWTKITQLPSDTYLDMDQGGGVWAVLGKGPPVQVHVSIDNGDSWTTYPIADISIQNIGDICYGNGRFLVKFSNGNTVYRSSIPKDIISYGLDNGSLFPRNVKSVVGGSLGGIIWATQPVQGTSYKKVILYCSNFHGTGTYTFSTPFTYTPIVTAGDSSIVTASETGLTVTTEEVVTGYIILEGF
jgi:hypothetical protein